MSRKRKRHIQVSEAPSTRDQSDDKRNHCIPSELVYLVLICALSFRLIGLGGALPHILHPDEPFIVDHAISILKTGDANPHWFIYPDLYIYLNVVIGWVIRSFGVDFWGHYTGGRCIYGNEPLASMYFLGRFTTACFGVATILATFISTRKLFGRDAAMLVAMAIGVSASHIEHSHYLTTDVPAAFFVALCLCFALHERWALSGVAAGLAAATKYNAGLSVILPIGLILARWRGGHSFRDCVVTCGACGLSFLIVMPWIFIEPTGVMAALRQTSITYSSDFLGIDGTFNWLWYVKVLFLESPAIFCMIAMGWVAAFKRDPRRIGAMLAFPILYWILIGSLRIRVFRSFIPILPVVLVGFGGITGWLSRLGNGVRVVLLTIAFGTSLIWAGQWSLARAIPDSRALSFKWINEHLPRGARILSEHYCPPVLRDRFRAEFAPNLSDIDPTLLAKPEIEYVITSSYCYKRYFDEPERGRLAITRYQSIFDTWTLIATFEPGSNLKGPIIKIYRRPGLDHR